MTPTKTKILQRTGLSNGAYEDVLFKTYFTCMSEISRTPQHLQLLLLDRSINKWFLTEVKKFNKEFIEDTIPFIELDKKEVEKHYRRCIRRIATNYPSALIKEVRINQSELILLSN